MRKPATLVLLLALCLASFADAPAQSRARRVGNQPQTQPPTAPAPPPAAGPAAPRERDVQEEVGEDDVVRVNATLVTIPVSVLDRDGRFIPGLRQQDFRIFEDGAEQEVAYFAAVEKPFTVALVLDTSGSTRFKLDEIQDAAIAFVEQLRPDDKVIVISFDDSIRVLAEATSDRRALRDAIRRTRTGGGTRLYDAFDLVVNQQLRRASGRKAVVLFTDGVDTTSKKASLQGNLRDAEELDALIYPVQYDTFYDQAGGSGPVINNGPWPGSSRFPFPMPFPRFPRGGGVGGGGGGPGASREEYRRGGEYLRELAHLTGGRHFTADSLGYLERAFADIAEELRRQYSLGYYPAKQSQAQERRQIRVRVKRPNLVVRARDSYVYKPAGSSTTARTDDATQPQRPELRKKQFSN